jgi:hypothetical protein
MALSPVQLVTLRADLLADPTLSALPNTPDDAVTIASAYNAPAVPDFWVWRSRVTETEYTAQSSVDGTVWSWPAYIARSQGERDGWARMFGSGSGGGAIDPSRANVRQGINDIFSGTQNNAAAQRTHLLTVSRRKATRAEKLFATGTGSTAAPAALGYEGPVLGVDVEAARALP